MRPLLILLFCLLLSISAQSQTDYDFRVCGPGGGGGQFVPSSSPVDPDLMMVACDMSGVYISHDHGQTWEIINYHKHRSSIRCGAIFHPTDPDRIWDETYKNWAYHMNYSPDGGENWETVWEMPSAPADMICLGQEPLSILVAGEFGIYRSTDGFEYNQVQADELSGIIAMDYMGTKVAAVSARSVFYSEDSGASFTELDHEILEDIIDIAIKQDSLLILTATTLYIKYGQGSEQIDAESFFYDRGPFTHVVASGDNFWVSTGGGGKYQSSILLSDDGSRCEPVFFCNSSWNDESNLENAWLDLDFNCGWGGAAIDIFAPKHDPDMALWTDYGRTLATYDRGETWQSIYTKLAEGQQREAGALWESVGLEVTTSWDMFLPEAIPDIAYIAYTDIGGAISHDGGQSWKNTHGSGVPAEWFNTTYDLEYDSNTDTLWGAFSGKHDIIGGWSANTWSSSGHGGVCYSTDLGVTWVPISDAGLPDKPVVSVSSKDGIIMAAVWSDGVWSSHNSGHSWHRISDGLDCGDGTCTNDGPNTHVVQVEHLGSGIAYCLKTKYIRDGSVIKNDGGLYRTTNYGMSWEFVSATVPECPPNSSIDTEGEHSWADPISFTVDPDDPHHIWVCAQNCNNGKVQGGLYETKDGGENWSRIYQIYGAQKLVWDTERNAGYLATTSDGLHITTDGGQSWNEIEEFPFSHVTNISIDDRDDSKTKYWINTYGGGVWTFTRDKVGVNDNTETQDISIWPNPTSGEIYLSGCRAGSSYQISDMTGRVLGYGVLTGEDIQHISCSGLSNGVYILTINNEMKRISKKILIYK